MITKVLPTFSLMTLTLGLGFLDKDLGISLSQFYGFSGAAIEIKGSIRLYVTLREGTLSTIQVEEFMILN